MRERARLCHLISQAISVLLFSEELATFAVFRPDPPTFVSWQDRPLLSTICGDRLYQKAAGICEDSVARRMRGELLPE
jgi:hypothetical protein